MAINRTRSRSTPLPPISFGYIEAKADVPDSEWFRHSDFPSWVSQYDHESISDEVGPRSTFVRPCTHEHISISNGSVPVPGHSVHIGTSRYDFRSVGTFGWSVTNIPIRADHAPAVDSFNRRSVRKIIDEIPTVVDLPTFIGELPDIPRTLKSLKDLTSLPFTGLNPQKVQNFREIREYKDRLSDPVLGYNFGVVPLWSDVTNFLGVQAKLAKRVDELRRTRGVVSKFKHKGTIRGTEWVDNFAPAGGFGTLGVEARWRGKTTTVVRTGGSFYHELGGLDTYANQEAALRSSLGLDNLFKSAWDLTRLSFLLDYVSNIGDLLSELKTNDAFTGEIQLRDTWSCTKTVNEASQDVRYRLPNGSILSGGTMTFGTHTVFNRTQGIPTSLGLVLNTDVSAREAVNILALV